MANQKGGGGGDDEVDRYRQETEAKESAQLKAASKGRYAFDRVAPPPKAAADQQAAMDKRPAKDVPMEEPAGMTDADDGDSDSGRGGGKSSSGGGPAPDLTLDTAEYAPFAADADTTADKTVQRTEAKKIDAEKFDRADGTDEAVKTAKAKAPAVAVKTGPAVGSGAKGGPAGSASAAAPGKGGGGTSGPSAGPG